jgi:hypothetical protein
MADWVRAKMVWNGILRFIIQQYPPILISGIITIYNVSLLALIFQVRFDSRQYIFSFVTGMLMLVLAIGT